MAVASAGPRQHPHHSVFLTGQMPCHVMRHHAGPTRWMDKSEWGVGRVWLYAPSPDNFFFLLAVLAVVDVWLTTFDSLSHRASTCVHALVSSRAFQFGQKKFRFDSIRFSLPNRFFRFDSIRQSDKFAASTLIFK